MTEPVFILALAYVLDLAVGDPQFLPHPVVMIGRGIRILETLARKLGSGPAAERVGGSLLVVIVVAAAWFVSAFFIHIIEQATADMVKLLGGLILIWLTSTTLATRGLLDAASRVTEAVRNHNLEEARRRLAEIVGRDTVSLDTRKVLAAAIETLAENASDGIIAPLFYYAIGGLPLAITYKAVNTMDSMLGYQSPRYCYFGWAAARLDDLANLIPARLTALLFSVAALALPRASGIGALATLIRDGRKHLSPNAGMPEAAMAGALGVCLGGPSTYEGIPVHKPVIGVEHRPLSVDTAVVAIGLTFSVSLLGFVLTALSLSLVKGMP